MNYFTLRQFSISRCEVSLAYRNFAWFGKKLIDQNSVNLGPLSALEDIVCV